MASIVNDGFILRVNMYRQIRGLGRLGAAWNWLKLVFRLSCLSLIDLASAEKPHLISSNLRRLPHWLHGFEQLRLELKLISLSLEPSCSELLQIAWYKINKTERNMYIYIAKHSKFLWILPQSISERDYHTLRYWELVLQVGLRNHAWNGTKKGIEESYNQMTVESNVI